MPTDRVRPAAAAVPDLVAAVSAAHPALGRLLADHAAQLSCLEWAEQEITAARDRNPRHADALYHSFRLLTGVDDHCLRTELAFRAHCRELLARVIAGHDTRLPTAAEMCSVLSETSLRAPLSAAGYGLYLRHFQAAGFHESADLAQDLAQDHRHHEALYSATIDAHDRDLRSKLTQRDRHLRAVTCDGFHHAAPAPHCRFASQRSPRSPRGAHPRRARR